MENRNNKLNELRGISPVVADISNEVTYTVPAGYFEGLPNQLLQLVCVMDAPPPVLPLSKQPYHVPQGYFEGLANAILQRVKKEETTLSPIAQQANNNPYQVPADYFNNLPAIILDRVKTPGNDNVKEEQDIVSPLLGKIGKKMPFSTPAGYFEELGENAIAGMQAIDFVNDALENGSPLTNGLKRIQVYQVPAGYFEQLPGQVLEAVKAQQPAKVVSMNVTRRILRYAAAAIVAGLIITGGALYFNRGANVIDGKGFTASLDSVSDDILENYLENQAPAPAEPLLAANSSELTASDMKDMLADVSDEDLQQYLEKYSTLRNIQTN